MAQGRALENRRIKPGNCKEVDLGEKIWSVAVLRFEARFSKVSISIVDTV
jgi:hypothetical protein